MLAGLDETSGAWTTIANLLLSADGSKRKAFFLKLPFLAIEPALFQGSKLLRVAEITYDFVDVGRFEELYELADKDDNGNVLIGDVILGSECSNNLIINKTNTPLLVTGQSGTVIAQTADGSLVSSFTHAAKVGDIYKAKIHKRSK